MNTLAPPAVPLLELSGVEVRYPVGRDWLGRTKARPMPSTASTCGSFPVRPWACSVNPAAARAPWPRS